MKRTAKYLNRHKTFNVPFDVISEYSKQRILMRIKYLNNIKLRKTLKRKAEADNALAKKMRKTVN